MRRRRFLQMCAGGAWTATRWHGLADSVLSSASLPSTLFGSMVTPEDIAADIRIRDLAAAYCDAIVVAGGVFWSSVEKSRGHYDFRRCDRVAQFGVQNGMVMRAHTLVSHTSWPLWLVRTITPNTAESLLTNHVTNLVNHFHGIVRYWDVLNEVIKVEDGRQDMLRNSLWLQNAGPGYLDAALVAAREADRGVFLGYNEWGLEDDGSVATKKRSGALALLRRLIASGTPIDYLGVQGHLKGGQTYSDRQLGTFLRAVEDLGLRILITELDVDDSAFPSDIATRDSLVADTYSRFLDVVLRNSTPDMITVWGLSDRDSWPQYTHPRPDGLLQRSLPFDESLQRKPAWDVLVRSGIAHSVRRSGGAVRASSRGPRPHD